MQSLKTGRPAPLERPSNIRVDATDDVDPTKAFHASWLAWLQASTAEDRQDWADRAATKSVGLANAIAGLLIFDTMCFEVLKKAYFVAGQPASYGDVVRKHLAFHCRLDCTTFVGKHRKLLKLLHELDPEVVCLQEHGKLSREFAKRWHIRDAGETAVLLRKDAFDVHEDDSEVALTSWHQSLEQRGRKDYGDSPESLRRWMAMLNRTCVCRARRVRDGYNQRSPQIRERLSSWQARMSGRQESDKHLSVSGSEEHQVQVAVDASSTRAQPERTTVPVVLCSVYGKSASAVGAAFVIALSEEVSAAFPDAAAYVIGMDSNTADSDAFGAALVDAGILSEAAFDPAARTVAKRRSRLQPQLQKAGVLDVSLKDFLVAWTTDGGALKPLIRTTEQFPELLGSGDSEADVHVPTAWWPFDHAQLVGEVIL